MQHELYEKMKHAQVESKLIVVKGEQKEKEKGGKEAGSSLHVKSQFDLSSTMYPSVVDSQHPEKDSHAHSRVYLTNLLRLSRHSSVHHSRTSQLKQLVRQSLDS